MLFLIKTIHTLWKFTNYTLRIWFYNAEFKYFRKIIEVIFSLAKCDITFKSTSTTGNWIPFCQDFNRAVVRAPTISSS